MFNKRNGDGRNVPICLLPTPCAILFFNFTTHLTSFSMNYFPRWCKQGFGDTRLLAPRFYVTTAVARGTNNEHGGKVLNFKRIRGPHGGVPCAAPWIFTNDVPVQPVPGTVRETTNTANIACDEKRRPVSSQGPYQNHPKVIPTGSQCKKENFGT